jgi:hypothetical protein
MKSFRTNIVPMMTALLRSTVATATDLKPDVIVYHPKLLAGPLRELRTELGLPARGPIPGPVKSVVPVSPTLLQRPAERAIRRPGPTPSPMPPEPKAWPTNRSGPNSCTAEASPPNRSRPAG